MIFETLTRFVCACQISERFARERFEEVLRPLLFQLGLLFTGTGTGTGAGTVLADHATISVTCMYVTGTSVSSYKTVLRLRQARGACAVTQRERMVPISNDGRESWRARAGARRRWRAGQD